MFELLRPKPTEAFAWRVQVQRRLAETTISNALDGADFSNLYTWSSVSAVPDMQGERCPSSALKHILSLSI